MAKKEHTANLSVHKVNFQGKGLIAQAMLTGNMEMELGQFILLASKDGLVVTWLLGCDLDSVAVILNSELAREWESSCGILCERNCVGDVDRRLLFPSCTFAIGKGFAVGCQVVPEERTSFAGIGVGGLGRIIPLVKTSGDEGGRQRDR